MRAQEPHPELQKFIEETEDAPAFHELPLKETRAIVADVFSVEEPEPVGEVIDRTINSPEAEIPVRIYVPDGTPPFPVAVFFHGGGFIAGGLDSHDQLCRAMSSAAKVAIVAVDYRLAPEHPFPAAVKDAYAATEWTAKNAGEFDGDGDRLAVVGDSSGGNLAAVVCHMARHRSGPEIAHQILIYPAVSYDREWPSLQENGEGYFLVEADLKQFEDMYFEDEIDKMNLYASPILSPTFEDLPPATVLTGGFDPIRDEGVAYAERLEEAGVDINHLHYDDAIHVFLQMATEPFEFDRSQEAFEDVISDLRTALNVE